ncbi:hypothetical protein SPFM10_00105 [Salmonella phage SPFM10]|nr:hypothetical protein SPFM10_00105 [Salmonella phage SPFM10]
MHTGHGPGNGKDFLYKGKGEGKGTFTVSESTEDWKTDCPTNLFTGNLEVETINEKCETRNSTASKNMAWININKEDAFIYAKRSINLETKFYLNSPEDDLGFENACRSKDLFQLNTRDGFFQLVDDEGRTPMDGHVTLRTSMTNGEKNASADPVNQMADDLSNAYVLNIFWEDLNNSNVKRLEDGVYAWSDVKKEDYVRIWRIGETDMY